MKKSKIVIVGMGFAGVYTYKKIIKLLTKNEAEITLIDKNNYFLFTPMLHEVATGGLKENLITESLREIIGNFPARFIRGEVSKIDLTSKIVYLHEIKIDYDVLVISTGSQNSLENNWLSKDNVFALKSVDDALSIKNRVLSEFEKADCGKECNLSFAVVGGGATGVELCMELYEFMHHTLLKFYKNVLAKKISLHLVDSGNELLKYFSVSQRKYAYDYLCSKNVRVHLNSKVIEINEKGVKTNKEIIETGSIFWAGGVKGSQPDIFGEVTFDENSRLKVNKYLQLQEYPEVFVLGDAVSGFPMLAYTATQQAGLVGENVKHFINGTKLKEFNFTPKVKLISLGQNNAMADIYGIKIQGRPVWFMWRTVYLFKVISFKKKIQIALNWTFHLFSPRDITKI